MGDPMVVVCPIVVTPCSLYSPCITPVLYTQSGAGRSSRWGVTLCHPPKPLGGETMSFDDDQVVTEIPPAVLDALAKMNFDEMSKLPELPPEFLLSLAANAFAELNRNHDDE